VDCERAQKLISLYLAGDLAGKDLEALMVHLAECDKCRSAFEEAKRYEAALKSMFQESVSKSRSPKSRVLRKIDSEGGRKLPGKSLVNWFVFIFLMAALCLLIVIAYVSYEKIKQENIEKVNRTRAQLSVIAGAINVYKSDYGEYPPAGNSSMLKALRSRKINEESEYLELDGLTTNSGVILDPWDSPYVYISSGETALLYSAGPNKVDDEGIGDDIRP